MSNAIQTTTTRGPLKKADVASLIEANKGELGKVLPKHLTIERLAKVLVFALDANPDLYKCTQVSLFRAVKQLAELGLEPGGVRGHAYLIPYKVKGNDLDRECQLIIGYKGLVHLAKKSGMVLDVEARVVHANDHFDLAFGLNPRLDHQPAFGPRTEPGAPLGAYCIATMHNNVKHVEFMTWAEIQRIRNASKASNSGPWVDHEEQMARKTVVRRWANYAELSPEMMDALRAEQDSEHARDLAYVDGERVSPPPRIGAVTLASLPPPSREEVIEQPAQAVPVDAPFVTDTQTPAASPPRTQAAPAATAAPAVSTVAELLRAIEGAAKSTDLNPLAGRISKLSPDDRVPVMAAYSARAATLRGTR